MNQATHIIPLDLSGTKGDTLFWDVYTQSPSLIKAMGAMDSEFSAIRNEFHQIIDDRSRAIVGAMIIENNIDAILREYVPKYNNLKGIKEFSFSFKIELLNSLRLIPSKILNAVEPLRKIRNNFAHYLEIKTFEQYTDWQTGDKTKDFESVYHKLQTLGQFPEGHLRNNHETLVTTLAYAFILYREQLKIYSAYVRNMDFVDSIFENSKTLSEGNTPENMKPFPVLNLNKPA